MLRRARSHRVLIVAGGFVVVIPLWVEWGCGGVVSWLGLLVVLCMFCRRVVGVKRSCGGASGVSRGGMCDPMCDKGRVRGW